MRGAGRGSASDVKAAQGSAGACRRSRVSPLGQRQARSRGSALAIRLGIRLGQRLVGDSAIAATTSRRLLDLVEPRQHLPQPLDPGARQRAAGAVREFRMQRVGSGSGLSVPRPSALPTRFAIVRPSSKVIAQLGAERLAAASGRSRERRGVDAPHQRPRGGVAERLALEMLEHDTAVEQGARQAVLHAELRVETRLRVGPVGMGEAARMRPRFDARHLVRARCRIRRAAPASHRPPDACCRSTDAA